MESPAFPSVQADSHNEINPQSTLNTCEQEIATEHLHQRAEPPPTILRDKTMTEIPICLDKSAPVFLTDTVNEQGVLPPQTASQQHSLSTATTEMVSCDNFIGELPVDLGLSKQVPPQVVVTEQDSVLAASAEQLPQQLTSNEPVTSDVVLLSATVIDQPPHPGVIGQSAPIGLISAELLFEYTWPLDDEHGEHFMLQEQVSEFLNVKSFKRKYPDLPRRAVEITERNYLQEMSVVTEMQCDLGLTALRSEDVLDLMHKDYPEQYEQYTKVLLGREQHHQQQRLTKKHKEVLSAAVPPTINKVDILKLTQKACQSAASFNASLMRERREERKMYYDLQTGVIQYPKHKMMVLPAELTRPTEYPVAVLNGQFCDHYKRYSPDELRYLPLATALYDPPKRIENPYAPLPPDPYPDEDDSPEEDNAVRSPPKKAKTRLTDGTCVHCAHSLNLLGKLEKCIKCNQCQRETHPSCAEITRDMLSIIVTYQWLCMECKVCVRCSDPGNEEKMIVCDLCDRGYHTFCVGMSRIPTGSWMCPLCDKVA